MCSFEFVTYHCFCVTFVLFPTEYMECFIGVGNGSYHRNCSKDAECVRWWSELYLLLRVVGAIMPLKWFYSI